MYVDKQEIYVKNKKKKKTWQNVFFFFRLGLLLVVWFVLVGWLVFDCLLLHFEALIVLWFVFLGVWDSCKCRDQFSTPNPQVC